MDDLLRNDLSAFFDGEFSVLATFCPKGQTCRDVSVVQFLEGNEDGFFYRLIVRAADFTDLATGDIFLIGGKKYVARDYVEDEYGLTLEIILNKEGIR